MRWRLTPARRRGVEILDDPATPSDVRAGAMADVVRSNSLFGGARAVLRVLRRLTPQPGARATLLDVGTGMGDIAARARRDARRAGAELDVIGLDVSEQLVRAARAAMNGAVVGDALHIPLADSSVDIVTCSQVLHHFDDTDAPRVVAELHRVARRWVVIADIRRSWLAAGGFRLASAALGFHPVTRADGVASVLRGFTAAELGTLVHQAVGVRPRVERSPFWRLVATWDKRALAP